MPETSCGVMSSLCLFVSLSVILRTEAPPSCHLFYLLDGILFINYPILTSNPPVRFLIPGPFVAAVWCAETRSIHNRGDRQVGPVMNVYAEEEAHSHTHTHTRLYATDQTQRVLTASPFYLSCNFL